MGGLGDWVCLNLARKLSSTGTLTREHFFQILNLTMVWTLMLSLILILQEYTNAANVRKRQ